MLLRGFRKPLPLVRPVRQQRSKNKPALTPNKPLKAQRNQAVNRTPLLSPGTRPARVRTRRIKQPVRPTQAAKLQTVSRPSLAVATDRIHESPSLAAPLEMPVLGSEILIDPLMTTTSPRLDRSPAALTVRGQIACARWKRSSNFLTCAIKSPS